MKIKKIKEDHPFRSPNGCLTVTELFPVPPISYTYPELKGLRRSQVKKLIIAYRQRCLSFEDVCELVQCTEEQMHSAFRFFSTL